MFWISVYVWNRMPPSACTGICTAADIAVSESCPAEFSTSALFVTRVPKTGGEALAQVLRSISYAKGGYKAWYFDEWMEGVPSGGFNMQRAKTKMSDKVYKVKYLKRLSAILRDETRGYRLAAHGHSFFIPSIRKISQQPLFSSIIMLRDPVKRLASQYKYDESMARNDKFNKRMKVLHQGLSFEDCALDPECRVRNEFTRWCSLQTQYACGYGDECSQPIGQQGLETALRNIREGYTAVGILEYFNDSLKLFEKILPSYFEDASSWAKSVEGVNKGLGRELVTPQKQERVEQIMDEVCALDNIVYMAAMERFQTQFTSCVEDHG